MRTVYRVNRSEQRSQAGLIGLHNIQSLVGLDLVRHLFSLNYVLKCYFRNSDKMELTTMLQIMLRHTQMVKPKEIWFGSLWQVDRVQMFSFLFSFDTSLWRKLKTGQKKYGSTMTKWRSNPISILATLVNKQTEYNQQHSSSNQHQNKEGILQKNDKQVLCVLEFYLLHVSDMSVWCWLDSNNSLYHAIRPSASISRCVLRLSFYQLFQLSNCLNW